MYCCVVWCCNFFSIQIINKMYSILIILVLFLVLNKLSATPQKERQTKTTLEHMTGAQRSAVIASSVIVVIILLMLLTLWRYHDVAQRLGMV